MGYITIHVSWPLSAGTGRRGGHGMPCPYCQNPAADCGDCSDRTRDSVPDWQNL